MNAWHNFRKLMSYVIEIPVARYASELNPNMEVALYRGRYKLITDGAIYSFSDLYTNFRTAFTKLKWNEGQYQSCLVLGLGLASIPDMLKNYFNKELKYTAVELDDVVIHMAKKFVLTPSSIPVEVFTADAASFLGWHKGHYDIICHDVFVGDRIPSSLQSIDALIKMKSLLSPNGILLYNRLSRYSTDIQESRRYYNEVFLSVFPNGGYIDVEGNWVLVSDRSKFKF